MRLVRLSSASLAVIALGLSACSGPTTMENPIATLQEPGRPGRDYLAAMQIEDHTPTDQAYHTALRRIVVSPNYVVEARRAAYARLREIDRDGLKTTLEVHLPKLEALEWRRELCGKIATDDWKEMTPTLIRAWAQPIPGWAQLGKERPERLALVTMYGEDQVASVLLDEMAKANPITQANLRTRCWELLLLEGQEDRLRALLADESRIGKDGMLNDIHAAVVDLGVLPRTREEIVWIRTLRQPSNAAFWADATAAVGSIDPARRRQLELRDVTVIMAAKRHRPELLTMTDAELDAANITAIGGSGRTVYSPDFAGHDKGNPDYFSERYESAQKNLTWGDRLAVAVAIEAVRSPQLKAHLFECGDRDLADKSTELGGLIDLDAQQRFELVEFPSRSRGNDARYEAPQQLMDALYVGLFHTHMHAQSYDNRRYAGPHIGDFMFADATHANCLVLSFIDSNRLDVDFYRHGRVVVDLGTIQRP